VRITAFNGSPKRERGNTHVMVSEFLAGAKEAGAEVENIFLAGQRITPCIACYSCWTKTPGMCVHDDDMNDLIARYLASDIIVYASPLYVDNVTGIMKNFMDRLIATGDPHMEKDANGECRHVKRNEKPTSMVAISNCGYPEQSQFQVLQLLFRRMARNFHCDLIAEIYRGAGGMLTGRRPEMHEAVEKYLRLVRTAGREVADMCRLSQATIDELEKPLGPVQCDTAAYIDAANRMWDSIIGT
jgi:multimeric flavodoxin WrbA